MTRRKRRSYTAAEKQDAVRLVRDSGKSVHRVARELDLTETALRRWVNQAEVDKGIGSGASLTTGEKDEFRKLRRENRQLRMEREFLKKAAAFFAKENS